MNLATEYLRSIRETTEDWDGCCGALADTLLSRNGGELVWVEGEIGPHWRYHTAALIDGLIHDAWCPGDALPIEDWLRSMFGDGVVGVTINGDIVYWGMADKYEHTRINNECSQGCPD